MASLPAHFDLFKTRIEPPAAKAQTAQEIPTQVREHLHKHPEFATEEPHTRLAGSYARKTANKGIKDVDILVFAHQDWRDESISDLMNCLWEALKELPETLQDGDTPELRRQRRSINVYLSKSDLYLDIVPVLKTGNLDDMLEVPDREWDEWVFTHPLGYHCLLSDLNADNVNKVVPLIKMIKHWRDIHFQRQRPKSYWLEALIVRHIARGWVATENKGYGQILAELFEDIYDRFQSVHEKEEETPFIPDPKLKNHVAWNWKRSAFETFMRRLKEAKTWARAAVDTKNDEEAVVYWKQVFGDEWFPSTADVEAECKKLGDLSRQGALFVTGSGLVLPQRPVSVTSVASPPKRFFGGE